MDRMFNKEWWNFDRFIFMFICLVAAFAFTIVGVTARNASIKAENTAKAVAIEAKKRDDAALKRDNEEEINRKQRIVQLNIINKGQCDEIELLKSKFRADAIKDYNNLDQTLALLNLERTPIIEQRAKEQRDSVLSDFPAQTCPRIVIEP